MSQFHDGVLLWWSFRGICGVVFEESTGERFFLHQMRILAGPAVPKVNDSVRFEVDPRPPLPGKLKAACNAIVLPQTPVAAGGAPCQK